jgi:hypothetical protein
VFAFLSVLDIVETGLNTVSRLAFRIAKQSNRAFRAVWTKPARMVPDMEIWMYSSSPTPIVRIGHNGPGQVELALPNMSPSKRDILGFGNVRVTFVDKEDDTPEKNHPRLEVSIIAWALQLLWLFHLWAAAIFGD